MAAALTTFYEQRHDNYLSLKGTTSDTLKAASDELKLATSAYQSAVDAGADLDIAIASKRAQMSAANIMPADVETLAGELRQLLIDRRHNSATLGEAAEALNFTETAVATAEAQLQELSGLLAQAATDLATAQQRQTHHDAWVATETEDGISIVRDLATDLLAENPITVGDGEINPADVLAAATARIDGDVPAVLLARARARATLAADRLSGFQSYRASVDSDLFGHAAASGGSSGLLAQRWAEYEAAENGLRNYALTSVSRFDLAFSRLTSIGASAELTQAESDRIGSLELAVDADEVTTETTLHEARAAVAAQELTIELDIVAARVADVNADAEADAAVIAARAELANRIAALDAAEIAHTEEFASAIDLWEGAIPDAVWANLQAYDSAISTLTAVSTSDASVLATAFTNAEDALVTAATTDDDNIRLDQTLAAASTLVNLNTDYLNSVHPAIERSVMRGDY